jgi:sulfur carrier protein
MITVTIEPEGEVREFASLNTALQLLNKLGLRRSEALVIRGPELLTPDRKLHGGDVIVVRKVRSSG